MIWHVQRMLEFDVVWQITSAIPADTLPMGVYVFVPLIPGVEVHAMLSPTSIVDPSGKSAHLYGLANLSGPLPDGDYDVTPI